MSGPVLYQKKPIPTEAHQWWKNGDHPCDRVGEREIDTMALLDAHPELIGENEFGPVPDDAPTYERLEGAVVRFFRRPEPEYASDKTHERCGRTWHDHGWIDDLEGGHQVCPGDWIVTGIRGEHWAVKPNVFAETYEPVSLCDSQLENVLGKTGIIARCTLPMDHADPWHESPQDRVPNHPLRWREKSDA